ncbi:MAG: UDP-N-acetylglucosamine acyltransferase [Granulosicoccus sp.]|jgi:UDP-N-acetylglucosamine acyltransferase
MNPIRNIHPEAKIGKNVKIGAFVTVEKDVVIGDNTEIFPNAVIMNGTRLGENCKIFPGAIVGSIPQDLKYKGERTFLEIGNNVTIREYCTINIGTTANWKTVIEDNCLIMAYCHIAHDCIIHERCVLANNVTLAGHIEVGPRTTLGGLTAVHQFVRIGDNVMVGGGSLVRKDIPPYIKAAREPLSYAGVNSIGLRRKGFSDDQINNIQNIYRLLYQKGHNTSQALEVIQSTLTESPERENILDFIKDASRGIIRGYRHTNGGKVSPQIRVNGNGNGSILS